jgi:hypothetical protein
MVCGIDCLLMQTGALTAAALPITTGIAMKTNTDGNDHD